MAGLWFRQHRLGFLSFGWRSYIREVIDRPKNCSPRKPVDDLLALISHRGGGLKDGDSVFKLLVGFAERGDSLLCFTQFVMGLDQAALSMLKSELKVPEEGVLPVQPG